MSRYQEAPQEVLNLLDEVLEEHFPELANCYIKVLMDSKKRQSKGRITFASIKKASDMERHLSTDNFVREGYDYIMMIDGNIWDNITTEDKTRIIRHELRHIHYDPESKSPYKIQDHDIQDFREEIRLNQDDPDWDMRVYEIAESVYDKS